MRPATDQRGAVTVEMVILMPLLLGVSFSGVHAALLFHARTLAAAAAQNGARAAAAHDGSLADGIAAATHLTQTVGPGSLVGVRIDGRRGSTSVTITVQASSVGLVPGLATDATASATLPVERITR